MPHFVLIKKNWEEKVYWKDRSIFNWLGIEEISDYIKIKIEDEINWIEDIKVIF